MAHNHKASNALRMPLDRENKSFQIMTETVKGTCQILKTVWQQVADHWTSSRYNNNSA